jgi:hypothetical protein
MKPARPLDRSLHSNAVRGPEPRTFTTRTSGRYHGHVRTWEKLEKEMKNALVEHKITDKRGRIILDETRIDVTDD